MKFKLKTLLLSIAFVAFVLFAMTNARHYWMKYYYAVTILILAISLTQAFVQNGAQRAFHIGFCIFGIGYLLIVFVPFKAPFGRFGTVTSSVMVSLHPFFEREMSQEDAEEGGWINPPPAYGAYQSAQSTRNTPWRNVPIGQRTFDVDPSMTRPNIPTRAIPPPPITRNVSVPTQQSFRTMSQAIWALLLGLIGGIIGRLSYKEKPEKG